MMEVEADIFDKAGSEKLIKELKQIIKGEEAQK
jgi:hypothetical protein